MNFGTYSEEHKETPYQLGDSNENFQTHVGFGFSSDYHRSDSSMSAHITSFCSCFIEGTKYCPVCLRTIGSLRCCQTDCSCQPPLPDNARCCHHKKFGFPPSEVNTVNHSPFPSTRDRLRSKPSEDETCRLRRSPHLFNLKQNQERKDTGAPDINLIDPRDNNFGHVEGDSLKRKHLSCCCRFQNPTVSYVLMPLHGGHGHPCCHRSSSCYPDVRNFAAEYFPIREEDKGGEYEGETPDSGKNKNVKSSTESKQEDSNEETGREKGQDSDLKSWDSHEYSSIREVEVDVTRKCSCTEKQEDEELSTLMKEAQKSEKGSVNDGEVDEQVENIINTPLVFDMKSEEIGVLQPPQNILPLQDQETSIRECHDKIDVSVETTQEQEEAESVEIKHVPRKIRYPTLTSTWKHKLTEEEQKRAQNLIKNIIEQMMESTGPYNNTYDELLQSLRSIQENIKNDDEAPVTEVAKQTAETVVSQYSEEANDEEPSNDNEEVEKAESLTTEDSREIADVFRLREYDILPSDDSLEENFDEMILGKLKEDMTKDVEAEGKPEEEEEEEEIGEEEGVEAKQESEGTMEEPVKEEKKRVQDKYPGYQKWKENRKQHIETIEKIKNGSMKFSKMNMVPVDNKSELRNGGEREQKNVENKKMVFERAIPSPKASPRKNEEPKRRWMF